MANYVQRACNSITWFRQRYEKFSRLLLVGQYSKGTIENYCCKIACVCLSYGKVPEDLSKDEIDLYLSSLLERKPQPASSMFVHVSVVFRCAFLPRGTGVVTTDFRFPPEGNPDLALQPWFKGE